MNVKIMVKLKLCSRLIVVLDMWRLVFIGLISSERMVCVMNDSVLVSDSMKMVY